jgi:hypothetical protein
MADEWECPQGLRVDALSRYSGCNISTDFSKAVAWFLMLCPPTVLLMLFAAAKFHLHDPRSSPARVQGMFTEAFGIALATPFCVYPIFQPLKPASADPTVALLAAISFFPMYVGAMKYLLEHLLASVFQMVYSLEPAKANRWTRRLQRLSRVVAYGMAAGMCIAFAGSFFARTEENTDAAIMVGVCLLGVSVCPVGVAFVLGVLELRALQKTVSWDSSIGKMLKMCIPVLAIMAVFVFTSTPLLLAISFVPWMRHRAWALLQFTFLNGSMTLIMLPLYELQQLRKRNALKQQQRQINPLDAAANDDNPLTSIIASTIVATKQALLSKKQVRREASASLVLHSGVSLAFLELFVREHSIDTTMTANDVVNKHVKPHTKEIGLEGSGAYVELLGEGADGHGKRWCATPTHMLSYSWSYSVGMIVAALRKYEQENPPSKGKGGCYYYFVDQVCSL